MHDPLYYSCYDLIFANKDYRAEAEIVLRISREMSGASPKSILDVGCGTGRHSAVFANSANVVAIDIDPYVIDIARAKRLHEEMDGAVEFRCVDVENLDLDGFDLAVSLFNVVNYIPSLDELLRFFRAIGKRLHPGAPFIFDCWNGVAALRDPPRVKEAMVVAEGKQVTVRTIPQVDFFLQKVDVDNEVSIFVENGENIGFRFQYHQTLWTPLILSQALGLAGFTVDKFTAWMEPEIMAGQDTWKIMVISRKR